MSTLFVFLFGYALGLFCCAGAFIIYAAALKAKDEDNKAFWLRREPEFVDREFIAQASRRN